MKVLEKNLGPITNNHHNLSIGRGNIDWEGTLKMLKKHKYKGFIAIDIGKLPSEYDLDQEILNSIRYLKYIASKIFD